MPSVIRDRQLRDDPWQLLPPEADILPEAGDWILSQGQWDAFGASRADGSRRLGLWIEGASDPERIVSALPALSVVAVRIDKFADGRAFSTGRLLRERHRWRGELRAIGDVMRDSLQMLERCGFDAFVLRAGEDPLAALAAFGEHDELYQASASEPRPLFRRRAA